MEFTLRKASSADIPEILSLIRELALYERAPDEVTITKEELLADGFGDNPLFEVILALNGAEILGMSFYYIAYSTWKGKCLYLEDIIVREKYRGQKVGKVLFEETIRKSHEMGAKRMMWQVLEWNEPAINFYRKYEAGLDPEWVNGRFTEKQIEALFKKIL
jgi:GNAT superfamily N-acetyltransferase